MKKNKQQKQVLKLDKRTLANLSNPEMQMRIGGRPTNGNNKACRTRQYSFCDGTCVSI